jgi:hypothetical protein
VASQTDLARWSDDGHEMRIRTRFHHRNRFHPACRHDRATEDVTCAPPKGPQAAFFLSSPMHAQRTPQTQRSTSRGQAPVPSLHFPRRHSKFHFFDFEPLEFLTHLQEANQMPITPPPLLRTPKSARSKPPCLLTQVGETAGQRGDGRRHVYGVVLTTQEFEREGFFPRNCEKKGQVCENRTSLC